MRSFEQHPELFQFFFIYTKIILLFSLNVDEVLSKYNSLLNLQKMDKASRTYSIQMPIHLNRENNTLRKARNGLYCAGFHDCPAANLYTIVVVIDGNLEIGSHERKNLCYLICLRSLIRSRAGTNRIFFLHACATCSELPSNIDTMLLPNLDIFRHLFFPW